MKLQPLQCECIRRHLRPEIPREFKIEFWLTLICNFEVINLFKPKLVFLYILFVILNPPPSVFVDIKSNITGAGLALGGG